MRRAPAIAALVLALALSPAQGAADVVIYRCTAADGAVTLQNGQRCPKGQREERRVLDAPAPPATPTGHAPSPAVATPTPASAVPARPASASPAGAAAAPRSAAAPVALLDTPSPADTTPVIEMAPSPAPPVFACRTWDGQRYYGDSERPAPRCAPLATTGLDGRSPTAAQACELRVDDCEPVADSARCDAWTERLRLAEGTARAGYADAAAAARTEAARLRTILAGTVCAR